MIGSMFEDKAARVSVKVDAPVFRKPLEVPVRPPSVKHGPHPMFEQFSGRVETVRKTSEEAAASAPENAALVPQASAYRSFQVTPHVSVKNEKIDRFGDVLAETYRELYQRMGGGWKPDDPDRVFFETVLTSDSFRTYLTTNDPLVDMVKARANMTWKHITLTDCPDPLAGLEPINATGYELLLKYPFFLSLKTDRRMQETPLAEVMELARGLIGDDKAVIQFGFQNSEPSWSDIAETDLRHFQTNKKPRWWRGGREEHPATRLKPAQAGYDFVLRILVQSADERRRRMIARGIIAALRQLEQDNVFADKLARRWRMKKFIKHMQSRHIRVPLFSNRRNIVTAPEIAHFVKLPQQALQKEHAHLIEAVSRPETTLPTCFTDPSGIFVGTTKFRDKEHKVYLPTKNKDTLMQPRVFMGSPRQGKDQAIINLIVESKRRHGIGAVIPDWIDERKEVGGHQRGMADAIRDAIPADEVIDIDWSNFNWIVPLSLRSIVNTANARIAADRVAKEITSFLMGDDIENHMTREYLRDAAKACFGDLLDIKSLFTNSDFRQKKIEEMEETGIGDAELWRAFDEDLSDARRAQIFAPVNVRLGEILNDEILAPIFCQRPNPVADLRRWIAEGKIVILRMPTRDLSELSCGIMAYFVTMVVFLIKLSLGGEGAATWLAINEPHQVETPGFVHFMKRLLAEGPKLRLSPLFAFHHLGQLSKDFADMLLASSVSWHLFYNSNQAMYEKLKTQLDPTFTPENAMTSTPRFHFIAAGWRDTDGVTQPAFMCKAPDLVANRWPSADNSRLTAEHAQAYGRPAEEVLADIKERSRIVRRRKTGKSAKASA